MNHLKIAGRWTQTPVSDRIFGNFIECGFGRQVPGMWGEMIYNWAFREIPPYKSATWEWLGISREYLNSSAPFWHSGYEENDWEPFGGPVLERTCGTYTFKGSTSLLVKNRNGGTCGLKQEGIHLQQGKKYHFHALAGRIDDRTAAGLNGFGDSVRNQEERNLRVSAGEYAADLPLSTDVKRLDWSFQAERTETVPIRLSFAFRGTLVLACVSLMPDDCLDGWRRDVVDQLRRVKPSVVRFPGGCFTSFFNWENSIGDRDAREPQPSFYWGGLEENDVGLDEFLSLAKLVGFEPQICFNMMTSTPFKARQMAEYLNADENTGMGRLRMLNGHPKPYGVRLFEMDNEPGRKWSAAEYARQCVAFAKEMRLASPGIEFMMACYSYPPEELPEMLEIAGETVNYIIYRDGRPEFVRKILPVLREYNRAHGTSLRLADTEWLPDCDSPEPFEDKEIPMHFRWHGVVYNDYRKIFSTQQRSWNYALNGAHRLMDYLSYGGDFALANFNNMCNTWGQNVIEATKETCYLSCMGKVFEFFTGHFRPCTAAAVSSEDPLIASVITKDTDSGRLSLYVVNHSSEEKRLALPDAGGNLAFEDGLAGKGRMAAETENQDTVKKVAPDQVPMEEKDGGQEAVIPPLSVCLFQQEK
ncbi:MAG: hypothetical protein ACOX8B_06085 [Lachnospiraceae bacterium]